MKLAVLGDVHGNVRALEAVVADAKASGAQQVVFLGDLVFMGLDPQLCFDLLMEQKPLVSIKGNTDAKLEHIADFSIQSEFDEQLLKIMKYTAIRMRQESKKALTGFVKTKQLELEGLSVVCCHGILDDDETGFSPTIPISPAMEKKLADEKINVVFSAHTHIPADYVRNGIRFINPGGVGYSFDGDTRASYALVSIDNGTITCKHKRVDYDIAHYKMEVEHALQGFPLFDRLLYALEKGKQKPTTL